MRILTTLIAMFALLAGITACSNNPSAQQSTQSQAITITTETVLLDVRTRQEWNEGHLEGAELLDFTGGDFAAALPSLDPDADYVLYCRSGNRAGQAAALMEDSGFTSVINAGSLDEAASATGLNIVMP